MTYGELRTRALAVAGALRGNGVRPGDIVALIGPKCAEQIPAVLGILAAGAAYLPIAADQPSDRTSRILESSGITAVLVCGAADPVEAAVPVITATTAMQSPVDAEPTPVDPHDLAMCCSHRGRPLSPGELWFSGRGIARGYRERPDLTAERFVAYDGRTWYRTGDLVRYQPDGMLEFVGRIDHRIKISGYRIELGEVEASLKRVPHIDAAVAAVIPGEPDVLAALGRTHDPSVDSQSVAAAMTELLPAHMIPKVIVVSDRIPFTVNGKIDPKAAARQLAEAELPAAHVFRPPSTPLESALAAIVADVLGVAGEKIGIDDDFFSLGGDSVLATQVIARVRDWLDTPTVLVTDMFAARSVTNLADRLLGREPGADRLN
ncbi:MAG: non-ribosomal peptide synthetase, partial [Mycobacterium sp.]